MKRIRKGLVQIRTPITKADIELASSSADAEGMDAINPRTAMTARTLSDHTVVEATA